MAARNVAPCVSHTGTVEHNRGNQTYRIHYKLANVKLQLVWEDNYKPSVKIHIYMSKDYSSTIYNFYANNGFLSPSK